MTEHPLDELGFEKLYREHVDALYRFILFKVSHRQDAEDLTQQVFIKAWERRGQFTGEGSLKAWVFQIARNVVIDYYRTRKRTEELPETTPAPGHPFDDIRRKVEVEEILKAVRALQPAEYGEVLLHRFVNELTVEETAEAMGKSAGAVRVLQHRALEALRRLLAGKEV